MKRVRRLLGIVVACVCGPSFVYMLVRGRRSLLPWRPFTSLASCERDTGGIAHLRQFIPITMARLALAWSSRSFGAGLLICLDPDESKQTLAIHVSPEPTTECLLCLRCPLMGTMLVRRSWDKSATSSWTQSGWFWLLSFILRESDTDQGGSRPNQESMNSTQVHLMR